jgi:energy-coupling factor transporter ATP-binding protein EcfA2
MTDHLAVEAAGLTKAYGSINVLGGVDLRVAPGSVFALLGPNGAGKTTMVRILSTLLRPDGGQARVAGWASPPTARPRRCVRCSTRLIRNERWSAPSPCTTRHSTTFFLPSPRRARPRGRPLRPEPTSLFPGDYLTMAARCARLTSREVDALMTSLFLPVMLMVTFVYLFGGAISTGTRYITYVVPGVLLLCAGVGSATTAVTVCRDMTGGIIDRFRSMDVGSLPVLSGHVAASAVRNAASTVLVFAVALAIGFRPHAGPATPVIETLRGLLLGTHVGASGWQAVAWCGGIFAASVALSAAAFHRRAR